jgi:hypothetical protein
LAFIKVDIRSWSIDLVIMVHTNCVKKRTEYKDNGWKGARSYESKVIHREGAELGDGVG